MFFCKALIYLLDCDLSHAQKKTAVQVKLILVSSAYFEMSLADKELHSRDAHRPAALVKVWMHARAILQQTRHHARFMSRQVVQMCILLKQYATLHCRSTALPERIWPKTGQDQTSIQTFGNQTRGKMARHDTKSSTKIKSFTSLTTVPTLHLIIILAMDATSAPTQFVKQANASNRSRSRIEVFPLLGDRSP